MKSDKNPHHGPRAKSIDSEKLDQVVAQARQAREQREAGYREQALKLYPWVCGRCGRAFSRENLRELTVHHKDMNHDNNPPDGSNWELLCLYCHDNEHQKYEEHAAAIAAGRRGETKPSANSASHRPFAGLESLLNKGHDDDAE